MATDLRKLTVSLTKHGAHKIANLLTKYDKDNILNNLWGSEPGIKIERAQAKKNLSADRIGNVPDIWNDARGCGQETINALVLIAIIFSHHRLIEAFQNGSDKSPFAGAISRKQFSDEKEFTNIAHSVEMLGYSTAHTLNQVSYNFQRLFQIAGLHSLADRLLRMKLAAAKWDQSNSFLDEVTRLGFHDVFSITSEELRSWLSTGALTPGRTSVTEIHIEPKDLKFFSESDDETPPGSFVFQPGHNPKKTGVVIGKRQSGPQTATLLHNEIQNRLFDQLVAKYGKSCVGTENSTGDGTSIDLVVKTAKFCWFYEIKTAPSVKACIRQALPQLIEYAYWHGANDRADKLIVVGPKKITPQATAYLKFLRDEFGLPVFYECFIAS